MRDLYYREDQDRMTIRMLVRGRHHRHVWVPVSIAEREAWPVSSFQGDFMFFLEKCECGMRREAKYSQIDNRKVSETHFFPDPYRRWALQSQEFWAKRRNEADLTYLSRNQWNNLLALGLNPFYPIRNA